MKSTNKHGLTRMVEIYWEYEQIRKEMEEAPGKFKFSPQEIEANRKWHYEQMEKFIPMSHEWEVILLTDFLTKPIKRKSLLLHICKRAMKVIKNLHIRAWKEIKSLTLPIQ